MKAQKFLFLFVISWISFCSIAGIGILTARAFADPPPMPVGDSSGVPPMPSVPANTNPPASGDSTQEGTPSPPNQNPPQPSGVFPPSGGMPPGEPLIQPPVSDSGAEGTQIPETDTQPTEPNPSEPLPAYPPGPEQPFFSVTGYARTWTRSPERDTSCDCERSTTVTFEIHGTLIAHGTNTNLETLISTTDSGEYYVTETWTLTGQGWHVDTVKGSLDETSETKGAGLQQTDNWHGVVDKKINYYNGRPDTPQFRWESHNHLKTSQEISEEPRKDKEGKVVGKKTITTTERENWTETFDLTAITQTDGVSGYIPRGDVLRKTGSVLSQTRTTKTDTNGNRVHRKIEQAETTFLGEPGSQTERQTTINIDFDAQNNWVAKTTDETTAEVNRYGKVRDETKKETEERKIKIGSGNRTSAKGSTVTVTEYYNGPDARFISMMKSVKTTTHQETFQINAAGTDTTLDVDSVHLVFEEYSEIGVGLRNTDYTRMTDFDPSARPEALRANLTVDEAETRTVNKGLVVTWGSTGIVVSASYNNGDQSFSYSGPLLDPKQRKKVRKAIREFQGTEASYELPTCPQCFPTAGL